MSMMDASSSNEDVSPGQHEAWSSVDWRKLGVELQQCGFARVFSDGDARAAGAAAAAEAEDLWWERRMSRTPREMLDAYFGGASDWTYEVKPLKPRWTDSEEVELKGLQALDQNLEQLGQLVTRAVSSFSHHRITGRSAGLLHCRCGDESEVHCEPAPKLVDPFEAGPYLRHCAEKKVVLLYAFDTSHLLLRPRSQPSDAIEIPLKAGDVLVYLHQALELTVESCCPIGSSYWTRSAVTSQAQLGLLLQLDLLFEAQAPHKTKQELVPLPTSLVEQYQGLFDSVEMAPEQMNLISLKDLHLDQLQGGICIASLSTTLPTLPLAGARMGAAVEVALLGGLDTATEVLAPPRNCSRSQEMRQRQYFGAKWDLSEYYDENPAGDEVKVYSKHMSVLYQSYDVAGDFDYRHFGLELHESYMMDQRCRMLCEGHAEVLHKTEQWRNRSEPSRDWGLFMGLSGPGDGWSLCYARSKPSTILAQVSEVVNFTGPVSVTDTDDSSGLVACHLAVQELQRSNCPLALTSSATFITSPLELALHCRAGLASRSGRTRCFDQSGDGFIQGEGAVVLMLQSKDSNPTGWNLVGSAVGSRGQGATLAAAPSGAAAGDLLVKASRDAAVSFLVVDAVETSSQGLLTDISEFQVLAKALSHKDQSQAPVMTSCSKASWGHMGPVSGLVGMARALLLMAQNLFGPQLHLRQLMDLPSRCHFCTEVVQGLGHRQLCSVASFGTGSNCQQLCSVKSKQKVQTPPKLSWYPTSSRKKDVLKAICGYQLVGSITTWDDGMAMTPDDPEEPESFACMVTLRQSGCEKFQIWIDGDPDRVLYPAASQCSESMVLGPEKNVDRSKSWKLRDAPGHRYEIRLEVNGNKKRVSWKKVSFTPLPVAPTRLSIVGDHTLGIVEDMKLGEDQDFFQTKIKLLKEQSRFRILCNADDEQVFYPAPDFEPETSAGDDDSTWTGLSGPAILGPDEHAERNFEITGKFGDIYRVLFDPMRRILRWCHIGQAPVDWEEMWSRQTCYVVGSWNNFEKCEEMRICDDFGRRSVEVVLSSSKETFQILLNRSWHCRLHPSKPLASMDEQPQGPDDQGQDHYWCIGDHGGLEAGDLVEIHLEMEEGRPAKVWWQKSKSQRAHKLYYCRGLQRTKERHLRLHGLIPYHSKTKTSARLVDAPEFFMGERIKEETDTMMLWYQHRQDIASIRKRHLEKEGPEAQLARELERLKLAFGDPSVND